MYIQGDARRMLKKETKDQFPLFDLPVPDNSAARPSGREAKQGAAETERPALPVKAKMKKDQTTSPEPRRTPQKGSKNRPTAGKSSKSSPGPIPEGDVRLTANIREDLHLKLKIIAATRRTTIGELIEDLVEHHL
jgi:hypothetical protein